MQSEQQQPGSADAALLEKAGSARDVSPRFAWRNRLPLLLQGESAVASVGLGVAAILLAVMASSAWWTVRTQRASLEAARAEEVSAAGDLLAQSAEALLSAG